jgi:hypothetical protein
MEHITITQLGGGYVRLTPDESYVLIKDNDTSRHFSDAEVKETEVGRWSAYRLPISENN